VKKKSNEEKVVESTNRPGGNFVRKRGEEPKQRVEIVASTPDPETRSLQCWFSSP